MCHGANKIQKENWKLGTGTVEIRNCGTPKLPRNYSETGEPWNSEITPKSLRNYSETGDRDHDHGTSETVACYSPLLVLVYRSVSQDPPPGRLKTLLLRRPFYTLRRQRSANQRSPMPTRHLADQSTIASRRTPPISERSDLSFALRKYLLN